MTKKPEKCEQSEQVSMDTVNERVKLAFELASDIIILNELLIKMYPSVPRDFISRISEGCIGIANKEVRINKMITVSNTVPRDLPDELVCPQCNTVVKKKFRKSDNMPYYWCQLCDKPINIHR